MGASGRHPVLPRGRRHLHAADRAVGAAHLPRRHRELEDRQEAGVLLRDAAAPAGGDERRVRGARFRALLRVLGTRARAHVLPDRSVGRPASGVRLDQVLPLHVAGLGVHARGRGRAVPPDRDVRPRRARQGRTDAALRLPVVGLPRVLPRLRREGACLPAAHVAARRARRGAHRGFGAARRHHAQDGDLRLLADIASHPAAGLRRLAGVHRGPRRHLDHLRRGHSLRPDRRQEARRVLVGLAHGLRDARHRVREPLRDSTGRWPSTSATGSSPACSS